jgi:hypothetical protein
MTFSGHQENKKEVEKVVHQLEVEGQAYLRIKNFLIFLCRYLTSLFNRSRNAGGEGGLGSLAVWKEA